MFGLGFILIGVLILLRAYGFLTSVSDPIFWGVGLIVVGIIVFAGRSMRRQRRREWIAQRRAERVGKATDRNQKSGGDGTQ
jgi:drug/metabolite transporter (DMT)-like permease